MSAIKFKVRLLSLAFNLNGLQIKLNWIRGITALDKAKLSKTERNITFHIRQLKCDFNNLTID